MANIDVSKATEEKSQFVPFLWSASYICSSKKVYVVWNYNKDDTGYIIYRDGKEIYNGEISEFSNSGNMFNITDHDTNLFIRTRTNLMYIDENVQAFKSYKYTVKSYRIDDSNNITISMSSRVRTATIE